MTTENTTTATETDTTNTTEATVTESETPTTVSAIDAALSAVKAARVPRKVRTEEDKAAEAAAVEAKKAEKAAAKAEKLAAYEAAKLERAAARAAKKAEKEAAKAASPKPLPHMAKVAKAAADLPAVDPDGEEVLELAKQLDASAISCVIAHLEHHLRTVQTVASNSVELSEGQLVDIVAGPAATLGCRGTVSKVQRIRVLVEVPGLTKPAYLFRADCQPVTAEASDVEPSAEEPAAAVG